VSNSGFDNVGNMIVDGVWQGMQQRESWFRSQVNTFFQNIVNSAKASLGIQSPSRVFAEIGRDMALGVGMGFEKEMPGVSNKIEDSIPTDFDVDMDINAKPKMMDVFQSILDIFRSLANEVISLFDDIGERVRSAVSTDFNISANVRSGLMPNTTTGTAGNTTESIVNNFHMHGLVIREDADINKIADALHRKQQQARRGLGVAYP
jgi:phage-related protein